MAPTTRNRSDTTVIVVMALVNGLLIATNVGLLSYVVNSVLDGKIKPNAVPNAATQYLLIFTASSVLIGATSVFLGFLHSARRNQAIRAAAFSLSLAADILYMLAMGFGAKQRQLGGEGNVERAIFALDIVLVVTGVQYSIYLYMGIPHEGTGGMGNTGVTGTGMTGAPAGAGTSHGDMKV